MLFFIFFIVIFLHLISKTKPLIYPRQEDKLGVTFIPLTFTLTLNVNQQLPQLRSVDRLHFRNNYI